METLEKKMLKTVVDNLSRCTDFPDDIDDFDEMDEGELVNWVKTIKASVRDNVNMINTIINNDEEKQKLKI